VIKVKKWVSQLLSLEERKSSSVMMSFLAFSSMGVYILFKTGDIPTNLSYIIMCLAGLILGVNIAPDMMGGMKQPSTPHISVNTTPTNIDSNTSTNKEPTNMNNPV
jgi:hypothetical protein